MSAIIITALLSSLITTAIIAAITRFLVFPKIKTYLEQELLPEAEKRVRHGVSEGVSDVLPAIRKKVNQGVSDALLDAASGGLLKRAPANIANNLESLTSLFFGKKND